MNAGKKYLRALKKQSVLTGADRKLYLSEMNSLVLRYSTDNPQATIEDYCKQFGDSKEAGVSQLMELSYEDIHRRMRGGALAIRGLIILVVFTLLMLASTIVHLVCHESNIESGHIEEKINYID